ncbi:MAG: DinB family protein [Candidatus Thorarchaeota archaeon]
MSPSPTSDNEILMHERVVIKRRQLWKKLKGPDFQPEWFMTRIKPHMWAIDEIYRHMLGSEIFYIHSKFGERRIRDEWAVGAQWVGDRHFGFKEKRHYSREELFELTGPVEQKSRDCLQDLTENDLGTPVMAPWGEEMTFREIIHHCFEHEHQHRGQIQYLITYFKQL